MTVSVSVCSVKAELQAKVDLAKKQLTEQANYIVRYGNHLPETKYMEACKEVQQAQDALERAQEFLSEHQRQHGC